MRAQRLPIKLLTTIAALAVITTFGCRQLTQTPKLPLFDGFEGNSIAGFWLSGNYGSGRFESGAIAISRSHARSGIGSVRITVKEGDIDQTNEEDGVHLERAELDSGRHPFLHRDVWVGFSFLVPSGFPVVDNRLVFAQWKQHGFSGGPLVAQRFRKGEHYLTVRIPNATPEDTRRFPLPKIMFDRWSDMIYHVRFSAGTDGRVELWMNGLQLVSYAGPTAVENGENSFYHKIGLYRDRCKEPMTIYFDNYTLGDSHNAVDPARFDSDRQKVRMGVGPEQDLSLQRLIRLGGKKTTFDSPFPAMGESAISEFKALSKHDSRIMSLPEHPNELD
jgi:hypothetical protein